MFECGKKENKPRRALLSRAFALLLRVGQDLRCIAAKPTASYDAQVPQSAQTTERFIRWLYAELKAAQH